MEVGQWDSLSQTLLTRHSRENDTCGPDVVVKHENLGKSMFFVALVYRFKATVSAKFQRHRGKLPPQSSPRHYKCELFSLVLNSPVLG